MKRVKAFVPPKPVGDWPEPPTVANGERLLPDTQVTHPVHGQGRYLYADWVDDDGRWVSPLLTGVATRRDSTRGHWEAVVTQPGGGYRTDVRELEVTQ